MRTLIVGAGAVGQYLAARLRLAEHDVVLLARADAVRPLTERGVTLCMGGRLVPVTVRATADTADPVLDEPFELVIVAVKSFSTAGAIDSISRVRGADGASVLSVQNGLGNEEAIADAFGAERTVAGSLTTAVQVLEPDAVRASPKGGLVLAPVGKASHNWLLAALEPTGMKIRAASDWRAVKWSKLALNLLGNAVCAVLDWSPVQVYADRTAFHVERACLLETTDAMKALRIQPIDLVDFPSRTLFWMARTLPEGILRAILERRISSARGGKLPSLLLDVRARRPQLEVEALNGAVAARAAAAGVPAPANATVTRLLTGIVRGDIEWQNYRGNPAALSAEIANRSRAI